jgi:hypothetical protein
MNAMGQEVMSGSVNAEKLVVSKNGLPAGIYILKMQNEEGDRGVRVRR